jgi:ketosteroid isomerase-like protein
MRTLTFFVVVAAVVVASCARTVDVEQEKTALLAADAAWEETAGDIEKFVAHFTPEGTMSLQGMPMLKGPAAIREALGPLMKAPGFNLQWNATRAEVGASGDLGYTVGTYEMTMNNAAGLPATEKGKFITTWKKVDGVWKVFDDFGNSDSPTPISSAHVVVPAAAVTWIDPPPSVPPGAKMAVISGNPGNPEPFTIRLQLPAGYTLRPHWHPTDEHVTVLSGTFSAAMGREFDAKALGDLPAGSYAVMSATMPHFARARTAVTLQVHGMGPFVVNYVNAADAPSAKVQ